MGARSDRITRDEFLIPPEFLLKIPNQHPSGRVGGARIELIHSGGSTRLGSCYQQIPVRLFPPFELDSEPAALLYLINLTAGLMDGDGHLIELTAREGTAALVTGQSATRIHPALESHATQQWAVTVEDHASLVVLPGPAIPFQGSRYYQRARVELAPTARLAWGDIWLPGRYERGDLSERFQFDRIVQDFEVHQSDRLVYRDRFCWDGPWSPEEVQWYFGGMLATASLFVTGALPEHLPEADASIRRVVLTLESGDTCVRWCGPPAEVTADLVSTALRAAGSWSEGPEARPWMLSSSELSPNHWFSKVHG